MHNRNALTLILSVVVAAASLLFAGCGSNSCPEAGSKAPDFMLPALSGGNVSSDSFRGQNLLVVFEGLPCPQCDKQRPFIQEALKASHKAVSVLVIFRPTITNPTPENILPHVEECRIADYATVLLDQKDYLAPQFCFGKGTPLSVLIDASGIIVKKQIMPFTSVEEVTKCLDQL